jgi:hypothetical protein
MGTSFSAPVQTDPGAHLTSYTIGTWWFPLVKRSGRGVDHPYLSNTEFDEIVELYLCSSFRPSWPDEGWTLLLTLHILWRNILIFGENFGSCHLNPLNAELNPICHLLALLGAHHILHVSRISFNPPVLFFKLSLFALYADVYIAVNM